MIKILIQEYMYHLTGHPNLLDFKVGILRIPFDQFYRQK